MIDNNNHKIKFQESKSNWISSFSLETIKCLIVCRGPVRKEAMDVFDEIGIREYGILLSEKDSIVYPMAYAPELRKFRFQENIHRVPDYMGAGKEEKVARIEQIMGIAKDNGYTHIFAGYGFMAEDAEFIEAIEKSGLTFMGPSSYVAKQAGAKDEAKKLARKLGVSVTPGVDNISSLALLRKHPDQAALSKLAKDNKLVFNFDSKRTLEDNAEDLLQLSYGATIDIISIQDLQVEAEIRSEEIWKKFSGNRIRYKYIGGGGGKGQRVVGKVSEVKDAVMEILAESKVTGTGSNRNFLIELNIENTRHNEIQLIGNGEWSLALGGRDCSLQMHEQKLLEISFTKELMEKEISETSNKNRAEILKADLKVLLEMEEQSERFGSAVKLNSVSTFESIVEGTNHFFMEMNTRIQVEHRVTEMAYKLKFVNPENKNEFFIVESLIEAMALISLYGKKVPKPERIVRHISGGEVRVNATNHSLQPHAGGLIQNWSPPSQNEIRDDQGIGVRNPDTGIFIHYRLAGAYDSNIALIVSHGDSRKENLERLGDILRKTELRGNDLQTNIPVHYGLINWILGKDVMFKPSTRFMMSYLAAVGSVESKIKDIDLEIAWKETIAKVFKESPDAKKILGNKLTLIIRPLERLFQSPHVLAGFMGFHNDFSWKIVSGKPVWIRNPIDVINDLYFYLNLEDNPVKPSSEKIWNHDKLILDNAIDFYSSLERMTGLSENFQFWDSAIGSGKNPSPGKINSALWEKVKASHNGFQVGLELLLLIPKIGIISNFFALGCDENLNAIIPDEFLIPEKRDALIKFLASPPKAKSDEIVAPMGGMFYSKEAPNLPTLVQEGDHFNAGQPLFIIEVMKMFNKISAPFSGTIVKSLIQDSDGKIVMKGQTLFKVKPDEFVKEETAEEIFDRKKKFTLGLL
ncbi:MAG: biotin carboxylase [Leptospira sp.]|nr:biotin carboxylase [Leptospira sp.]